MKKIDLSDIKENDLDKTSSFTDLMSKREKKYRTKQIEETIEKDDIEDMVNEKKKSTKDLTKELEEAKNTYNKEYNIKKEEETKTENEDKEDNLGKTQILELTRQMKFNFEENKQENNKNKKKGISILNVIGEVNLFCIAYYIYLLGFTNYQDDRNNYIINGGIIILLVLLFGLSVVTNKKVSKFFNILNILTLLAFLGFNAYTTFC